MGSANVCWRALAVEYAQALGVEAERLAAAILATRTEFWADSVRNARWRANFRPLDIGANSGVAK